MSTLKPLDSLGGFSINNEEIISSIKDVKNVNTFELKNSQYSDITKTLYILKGTNTQILQLDDIGSKIILPSSSISFITANIVGIKDDGSAYISLKFETAVTCDASNDVVALSSLTTIIKEELPSTETWTVVPYDSGSNGEYSYSATVSGTTDIVKWASAVEVVSVLWS